MTHDSSMHIVYDIQSTLSKTTGVDMDATRPCAMHDELAAGGTLCCAITLGAGMSGAWPS